MNRIVLIGNGFDLAHGLSTRYEDFINWYWDKWGQKLRTSSKKVEQDLFCSFVLKENIGLAGWYLVWSFHYQCSLKPYPNIDLVNMVKNDKDVCDFKINSTFFERICKAIKTKGWVDIEREYYDLLRDVVLKPEDCNYTVSELNSHLYHVQELLVEYFNTLTISGVNCDKRIHQQIYSNICKNDISISQLSSYNYYVDYLIHHANNEYKTILGRYGLEDSDIYFNSQELNELLHDAKSGKIREAHLKNLILPENILLLNFNYTTVADKYGTAKVSTVNHIHGNLSDFDSIILGYGDELDDDYNEILQYHDNECLKNIKSIKYLEAENYRNMLQFLESAPYQVFIMGHSCGNSDRTLLNTLFEHNNCVSIKPYYHQKKDGSDNYLEIVQNICRNFTDMKLMRDRVVNKTFCEPLPQCTQKN